MKLVSAIITTHNRLELLKRAIDSVRNQTYGNIELIVVDDASTDGTAEYCDSCDFTFIHIPKEESKGGNHARNIGILASKGEYVAFLDDDDYWLPEKITKQVALLESRDCELVHCGRRNEIVTTEGVKYREILPEPIHYGAMSKNILLTVTTAVSTNIMVKRQALIEVGMFDEELKYMQDYELLIRLAQRKPFWCVHEVLSVYRVNVKDKARLTNNYFEWKSAVNYIHAKHKNLYDQLNKKEHFIVKLIVWKDGAKRCKTSGLWMRFFYQAAFYVLGTGIIKMSDLFGGGQIDHLYKRQNALITDTNNFTFGINLYVRESFEFRRAYV